MLTYQIGQEKNNFFLILKIFLEFFKSSVVLNFLILKNIFFFIMQA